MLPDESIVIEHTDVNCILRIGSTMYFGTMYGLLYLDLYNRDWNLIDETNGLNDSAVWDLLEYEGSILVATANGMNEVSIVNQSIIPDRSNRFEGLARFNIYELEADSQYLYLASDAGLLQLNWEVDEIIIHKIWKIDTFLKIPSFSFFNQSLDCGALYDNPISILT